MAVDIWSLGCIFVEMVSGDGSSIVSDSSRQKAWNTMLQRTSGVWAASLLKWSVVTAVVFLIALGKKLGTQRAEGCSSNCKINT